MFTGTGQKARKPIGPCVVLQFICDVTASARLPFCKWLKLFAEPAPKLEMDLGSDKRRLKRELVRVTDERDILKNHAGLEPACAR